MGQMRRFLQDPSCVFAYSFGDLQYVSDNFTITGSPTIIESPTGKAMAFDLTNPDNVKRAMPEITTEDFSVIVLMRNSQILTSNTYMLVTDKEVSNQTKIGWALILKGDAGLNKGVAFRINDGGQVNDSVIDVTTDRRALLSDGNWHLIGVTIDRDGAGAIFVDSFASEGSSIGGQTGSLANDQDLTIGSYGDNSTQPFTGSMAFALIYKRLLSAKEIENLNLGRSF